MSKETRIIYRKDANLLRKMQAEDAKRLILAYLDYEVGEPVEKYFPDGDNLQFVFFKMAECITANELKYNETVQKRREAGKKGGEAKAAKMKSMVDTSTGEVFIPTDEPMTSELTVGPILEEEQPYTNTTLSEFIKSRPEGMMQCPQWSGFVAMYPDAEKIQKISGITELYAVTLYSQLRKNAFAFGN